MCEWVSEWVSVSEGTGGARREAAGGGYRTKNKNPTRQCGEKDKVQPRLLHRSKKLSVVFTSIFGHLKVTWHFSASSTDPLAASQLRAGSSWLGSWQRSDCREPSIRVPPCPEARRSETSTEATPSKSWTCAGTLATSSKRIAPMTNWETNNYKSWFLPLRMQIGVFCQMYLYLILGPKRTKATTGWWTEVIYFFSLKFMAERFQTCAYLDHPRWSTERRRVPCWDCPIHQGTVWRNA